MQPYEYEGGRRLGNYAQSGERLAMDLGIPNPYSIMRRALRGTPLAKSYRNETKIKITYSKHRRLSHSHSLGLEQM